MKLTQGLDPVARRATWEHVGRLRETRATVVLFSHHTDEVEALCDRVAILGNGRIVRIGTVAEIVRGDLGTARIRFSRKTVHDVELPAILRAILGVAVVREQVCGARVAYDITGRDAAAVDVAAVLAHLGSRPVDYRVDPPTLEDVLVSIAHTSTPAQARSVT